MVLFYALLTINFLAFLLIGYDKFLAKNNKRRIPEKILLSFVFIGGTIGSGLAMLIFRHKTSKRSYLWKFFGVILIQLLIIFWICQL